MENLNIEYKSEIPKKSNHLKAEIISFLKKKNITYPTLMDEAGKSFDDYKVRALPMTYVINKDGYLEGFVSGAITSEQLRKAVNETLKKK